MEAKLKFLDTLTLGLENMLSSGTHADVTIVVDGKVFPCHKVVLCALSPYFEAMFNHDMIETRGGIVTLYDIEPHIFDSLLKFFYTGDDVVNEANAEQIFRASSMLQIPCLQERCEDFLLNQVSHDNCIGIWKIAKAHNCQKLAEISLSTILENFAIISTRDEFQKLEIDEILCILISELLSVPSEEIVCEAVMSWIKFNPTQRQSYLKDIVGALRLPLVSTDFLFSLIDDEHFDTKGDIDKIVQEAFRYNMCPAKRQSFTSERVLQRNNSDINDCLVIIGGLLKTVPRFQTTKEVVCYSFQQEQWFYLPSLPNDPGYEFAVCSHGSDIYVSGGWLKLQGMSVYRAGKNKWKVYDSMTRGRCGHAMVALTSRIVVLGGRDVSVPAMTNIEEFNLKTKKWRTVGDLLVGVRSMSSAVVGENVFLFGGITDQDKDTDKVQCYDTRLETATIIGDLPWACRLTRSVACDDVIYIVLPDGRILTFDRVASARRQRIQSVSELSFPPESDEDSSFELSSLSREAQMLPSPTSPKSILTTITEKEDVLAKIKGRVKEFNQHHFETIQHRGNLLLAGGKKPDNTILRSIAVVNPNTSKIVTEIEMPSARWCFGFAKIVIHKDNLNNAIGVGDV